MLNCPNGCGSMTLHRKAAGARWICSTCSGQATTIAVLRKQLRRDAVDALWQQGRTAVVPSAPRGCPSCRRGMRQLELEQEARVELDLCPSCHLVWFDLSELEVLPERPAEEAPRELPPEARLALARARMDQIESHYAQEMPDSVHPVAWLPAIFGLPVEQNVRAVQNRPVATLSTIAIVALVSILGFGDFEVMVESLALDPAAPLKLGGLTFFTYALLHGSWFHLLGNLYFLAVFGDNVEDLVGPKRFVGLLLLGVLVGGAAQVIFGAGDMPLIGISGGVSAVLVVYALCFPHARVGFLWMVFPIVWPIWIWLGLWLALQLLYYVAGFAGLDSGVAFAAHLGGAAAGLLAWVVVQPTR